MQHDDDVIHFTSSAAGAERLRVTRFTGRESISHCFRYEIDLVLDGTSPLEAIAVMKQDAALGIEHGESRNAKQTCWIHGTLAEFEARGQGEHTSTYRAVLVPRLWSLGMGRRTRVFVDKSVVQIITAVLDDAKIPGDGFEFRLKGAYTPREHTVQYQESDLAFITRLMEREGMFYFFVHDEKATKLVIADQQQAFPEFTKGASTIPYLPRATGGGESAEEWFKKEVVDAFTLHQRLVPGEVVLRDWNWRQPGQDLTAKAVVANEGVGNDTYLFGEHYPDGDAGAKLATMRAEELKCRSLVYHGSADQRAFRSGHIFTIDGTVPGKAKEFLLVGIEHAGTQHVGGKGGSGSRHYRNHFTAIPTGIEYRSELSSDRPQIAGVINATIDGTTSGQYAEVDAQGRYRVRLPFERGDHADGKASRAMRMAQPYGGTDHGIHFPLHKGAEVLITHVNGDPDRPIIAAAVPNPDHPSLITDATHTQAVIRTAGKNELRFEDVQGGEKISLTATKDHHLVVGNNETHDIATNLTQTVGSDRNVDVGRNQSTTIGINKSETVGVASEETIGAAKMLTIGAAYQVSVGAAMNETVVASKTEEVGAYKYETVGGNRKLNVGGKFEVVVAKDHHDQATQDRSIKAKKISIEAEEMIQFVVGSAKIIMKKNGDIVIEGANITVKGSGNVVLKGQKIAEN